MSNEVLYSHLTPAAFRTRLVQAPIAYLPLGTLEWHGEHLPLGSDGLQAQGFFIRLAGEVGGVVMPMLFLGPDILQVNPEKTYYGMDIVGFPEGEPHQLKGSAYWLDERLFDALLESILANLERAGFKIVVAHGHGPSTRYFQQKIGTWQQKYNLKLLHCWDGTAGLEDELGLMIDHAAANETSLMMALHPDLVHLGALDPRPEIWPVAILGKDPRRHASIERGELALQKQTARMATLLKAELAALKRQDNQG